MTAETTLPFDFDLLKTLCEIPGVAGREDAVRAFVQERMREVVDDVTVDRMGNVIGKRQGSGGPTVMLAAHMDEIGFIVKHIDDKGFLRLQPIGGFDPRVLPAQRVVVHGHKGERLTGVLALQSKPIHLLSSSEMNAPKIEEVFVDVGLTGDEAKERIEIGDMVVMDRTVERAGNNVIGKAMDDRLSVFVMLEALRALGDRQTAATILAVASVQEEVGLRGARTAAFNLDPDIGVALDVTLAMDIPGGTEQDTVTKLGEGPAIKIMDSSHISNHKLVSHFRQIARENDITHQMEILPRGGTDAGAIHLARGGTPVITLSFPTRYIHTVNEMCSVSDIKGGIELLTAYLEHAHEGDYSFG